MECRTHLEQCSDVVERHAPDVSTKAVLIHYVLLAMSSGAKGYTYMV